MLSTFFNAERWAAAFPFRLNTTAQTVDRLSKNQEEEEEEENEQH